ncbi:MAG: Imm39 family immunity protein, partial [Gammaproteobacteria bacterium]
DKLPSLIGGVGLARGSVRGLGPALAELSSEISDLLASNDWIKGVPFNVVSLIVRYGDTSEPRAELGRVNRHGELKVAVQASHDELRASKGDVPALKASLLPYVLLALDAIAERYNLGDTGFSISGSFWPDEATRVISW